MSKEKKVEKVKTACEKNIKNCSGFVKAVADDLGIIIIGQANDIVNNFKTALWKACTDGVDARQKTTEGHLSYWWFKKITQWACRRCRTWLISSWKIPYCLLGKHG